MDMYTSEVVTLEKLVPENHMYRRFVKLWSFYNVEKLLLNIETDNNYKGYGLMRLFKCLLLQFMKM